jgi:hypothetical protein
MPAAYGLYLSPCPLVQHEIVNVSLTAVTMLWNVTDTLARSKGATAKAASLPAPSIAGMQQPGLL